MYLKMAGKFKIYCDDCPKVAEADELKAINQPTCQKPSKREPLGLRQTISHAAAQEVPSSSVTTSSSALSVNDQEDQENDVSMASLGSDFVPSILHDSEYDDDRSFEFDEEADDEFIVEDEDQIDDVDFEADEELRGELQLAFKQHDESQLFKSAVYINDIQSYLMQLEREPELRPLPNYMDYQTEIRSEERAILINWLVDVSEEYDLSTETLFICTGIIDRFLSKVKTSIEDLQLLGVAAMFIASKYEEIHPPELCSFVEVTDDSCSGKRIREMEQDILKTLNFRISVPTISFFLRQIFAFNKFSKKVYHLAEYLCYLSLLIEKPFLEYYPSDIALGAVILAAHQLDSGANISTELKSAYDKSNLDQLRRRTLPEGATPHEIDRRVFVVDERLPFCIESLRAMQERAFSRTFRHTSVIDKFQSDSYDSVALLPPPTVEDIFAY